jgi:hypothetical protein
MYTILAKQSFVHKLLKMIALSEPAKSLKIQGASINMVGRALPPVGINLSDLSKSGVWGHYLLPLSPVPPDLHFVCKQREREFTC